MGLPQTYTYDFVGGDTVNLVFQIKDRDLDDPESVPVVRDLTGWTAFSQVRATASSDAVLATWEITNTLGVDGYIRMKLTGAQTQPLIANKTVVSDVELTDPDGNVTTILKIVLNITQDVTRE